MNLISIKNDVLAATSTLLSAMIGSMLLLTPVAAQELFLSANLEQFETRLDDEDLLVTEGDLAYGGDDWKLHGIFEGEYTLEDNEFESLELQARFSKPIAPFWDAYGGIRHDIRPTPNQSFGVVGITGLAPYFIETDASLFLSEDGDTFGRFEMEKDLLITQRLVLQPLVELDFSADDGMDSSEFGLRLRYEFTRDIAPYFGVNHEQKWGQAKRLAEQTGEDSEHLSFMLGLKLAY